MVARELTIGAWRPWVACTVPGKLDFG
jgi:hypothetical protein